MDCSLYVISSPIVYLVSMLTGYIIARYKIVHEMEHLYKYNDELQEEVNNLNEVLAKVIQQENSDVD